MKTKSTIRIISIFAAITFSMNSCTQVFEYSPYDAAVSSRLLNQLFADEVEGMQMTGDTLRFALFADSHSYFDQLKEAVKSINSRENVSFAICAGDVADAGLSYQFEQYADIIESCKYPVFTAIGNHDHRSSGSIIYERLFGSPNTSFVYGRYKFVFFDDVIWEKQRDEPDFDWLARQLDDTSHLNILITHVTPWDIQFTPQMTERYAQVVRSDNTLLCLHGHGHGFGDKMYNNVRTIISGSVEREKYNEITLVGREITVERIAY